MLERHSFEETSSTPPRPTRWNPRNLGFASIILALAGCRGAQVSDTETPQPSVATSTTETSTPAPPPLSDSDALAEQQTFRMVFIHAKSLCEERHRRQTLQESLQVALPQDKDGIEEQILQCQLQLELTAFDTFKLIQGLNPRTWPRMINALTRISNGEFDAVRLEELSVEQFGPLAHTPTDTSVLELQRAMYFQQVELLAIAVSRMDRSIQALERLRASASPEQRQHLQTRQTQLRRTRQELIDSLQNGQLLPNNPQPAERLDGELLEHFLQKREERGGLPRGTVGQPQRVRFGDGSMPGLELRLVPPARHIPPQDTDEPQESRPEEPQRRSRPSSNRPRVA